MLHIIERTIVIHGGQDDFTTQPSGNAGVKLACGVIKRTSCEAHEYSVRLCGRIEVYSHFGGGHGFFMGGRHTHYKISSA
ncbi:MAG: superoxide dismutase family protein [Clostridia bacterium]|nr:superoxide dismutase family protein [Clostridia bacterium]